MAKEQWKTINGAHVRIRDGQSVDDAFDDSVKNSPKQACKSSTIPGEGEPSPWAEDDASSDTALVKDVHKKFNNKREVDEFFLYDDEKRGLLAKKNSAHGRWEKSLTPHQRYVINDYTSDGYSNINSYLRGYDNGQKYSTDYVKGAVKSLDDAIATYDVREPFITYRSIDSAAFVEYLDDFSKLEGTEYFDKAFMSTSPDLNSPALNKDVTMTIKVPKGKNIGAYINEYNGLSETEFLLARNSKFMINKAYFDGKGYHIEMELIK